MLDGLVTKHIKHSPKIHITNITATDTNRNNVSNWFLCCLDNSFVQFLSYISHINAMFKFSFVVEPFLLLSHHQVPIQFKIFFSFFSGFFTQFLAILSLLIIYYWSSNKSALHSSNQFSTDLDIFPFCFPYDYWRISDWIVVLRTTSMESSRATMWHNIITNRNPFKWMWISVTA